MNSQDQAPAEQSHEGGASSKGNQPSNRESDGGERRTISLRQYLEDDEDSRSYFLSEPSISTDGGDLPSDITGSLHLRPFLLSPHESLSGLEEDVDADGRDPLSARVAPSPSPILASTAAATSSNPLPPVPPSATGAIRTPHTLASSPDGGNTSLSSRDSLTVPPSKVQLQFKGQRLRVEPTPDGPVLSARPLGGKKEDSKRQRSNATVESEKSKKESQSDGAMSSRSLSSVSMGQQLRAAEFLQDLKLQSVGAVEDAASDDFDSDRKPPAADRHGIDAVMRRQERSRQSHKVGGIESIDADPEGTIVMTLSASSEEENPPQHARELSGSDQQHHSVDDERTAECPPRRVKRATQGQVANKSGPPGGHRRSRSGDDAAANLMTGGVGWRGMQQDRLPLPDRHDDEDDDIPHIQRTGSASASSRLRQQSRPPLRSDKDYPKGIFVTGSSTSGVYQSRKARRPQRQTRGTGEDPRYDSAPGASLTNSPRGFALPQAPTPDNSYHFGDHFMIYPYLGNGAVPRSWDMENFLHQMNSSYPEFNTSSASYYSYQDHLPRRSSFGGDSRETYSYHVDHPGRSLHCRRYSEGGFGSTNPDLSSLSWISPMLGPHYASVSSIRSTAEPGSIEGDQQHEFSSYDEEPEEDDDTDGEDDDDESEAQGHISKNRLRYRNEGRLESAERLFENREFRGKAQHVLRSPRAASVENSASKGVSFKPVLTAVTDDYDKSYPTFVCPQCGLKQRSFFTASTAPTHMQGPASYLAVYFFLYVVASLYIFGLEEGWDGVDCVYFAVITLTTAGLGDLTPTSDSAKIICSIFIYFGVACIGLLLGTYLAGMMDEKQETEVKKSQVDNCVRCSTIKTIKEEQKVLTPPQPRVYFETTRNVPITSPRPTNYSMSERQERTTATHHNGTNDKGNTIKGSRYHETPSQASTLSPVNGDASKPFKKDDSQNSFSSGLDVIEAIQKGPGLSAGASPSTPSPRMYNGVFGSPMTTQILGRQRHTRHHSFDVNNTNIFDINPPLGSSTKARRKYSDAGFPSAGIIPENSAFHDSFRVSRTPTAWNVESFHNISTTVDDNENSDSDESWLSMGDSRVKNAKYVLLTLRQALMNSILIIAVGGLGFHLIEKLSIVDSFYFTTVLLTTVGYGDITPHTKAGKLFATIYLLVAGTVLLNNMSLISMIPLELRKRRIEKAVLTQFGDQLDDAALRELATGPLIKRLQLSNIRTDGLDECTREMFALAMLVRLGKVTERDIRQTFAAFRRLDVDDEGVLNSRTIIAGLMQKHRTRSMKDLREGLPADRLPSPPPPPLVDGQPATYWFGDHSSLHMNREKPDFRFADIEYDSEHENLASEQAALLGRPSNRTKYHSPSGGTFCPPPDEEEGAVTF